MKKLLLMFLLCSPKLYSQELALADTAVKVRPLSFEHVEYVPEIEAPLLAALQHFPELENFRIRFRYKNIKTTMVSRPTAGSLFRKNRTFVIYIDNQVKKNNGIILQDIPAEARIGLIGHELCHIIDYSGKTNL